LETAQKEQLNVHLGPADAVADTVAKLSVGQMIVVKAFRTEKMKEKHYVAQSLTFDKTTVKLRDAGLRPVWAGRAFGPQRPTARGAGFGRGRGQGRGLDWGRGQRRGSGWGRSQGRGPNWARGGQRSLAPPQPGPATHEQGTATARKVAVTAASPSMDAAIDPRFGRCRYFLLVDTERETFEVLENTPTTGGNAGVQAAEMIAGKGAQVLLTGECGPKASKALAAAGIEVIPGCSGTVGALVKQFKAGQLAPASKARTTPDSASGKVPGPGKRRP
jgi:predicted Fe-Mo cluster-binding NifX family protein